MQLGTEIFSHQTFENHPEKVFDIPGKHNTLNYRLKRYRSPSFLLPIPARFLRCSVGMYIYLLLGRKESCKCRRR